MSDKVEEIERAIAIIEERSAQPDPNQKKGEWLEQLTAKCAPLITSWNLTEAWIWKEWKDRPEKLRNTADVGIDVVGRRADGKLVAIQCKSRLLDQDGKGHQVTKNEMNSFLAATAESLWTERWLVVNGDISVSSNADSVIIEKNVIRKNLKMDLLSEMQQIRQPFSQSRDEMQAEAISKSVDVLRRNASANESGRARGRLILPCGTGKSRIALRLIEELTGPGQVSAVLCPSIALVAQLRQEFLGQNDKIRILSVCSDKGVAKTPQKDQDLSLADDPTEDLGHTTIDEITGDVTTKADVIANWMDSEDGQAGSLQVIIGTYQSSHQITEALQQNGREIQVMIADEAHRTAGLRRIAKLEEKIRDFTLCHDDRRFPVKYRVYQTATPRVYSGSGRKNRRQNDDWIVRDMSDESVFGPELYRRSYVDAINNGWLTDYRIIAIGVNDKGSYELANKMAEESAKGTKVKKNMLSTTHFLRGLTLALVMGGQLKAKGADIRSTISFMNLTAKSKAMAAALQTPKVRQWVKERLVSTAPSHNYSPPPPIFL